MVSTRLASQSRSIFASPRFGEYMIGGCSLSAGSNAGSSASMRVGLLSAGRFRMRQLFAAGGKTSAQVLSEQVPSMIASGIKIALIDSCRVNDLSQGLTEAQSRANAIAIWTALRDAGIFVVDLGPFPHNTAASALVMADHELWRRLYCAKNGIAHVDCFSPIATAAGAYRAGYNVDTLHPSAIAESIVARKILEVLDKPWSIAPLFELIDRADGNTVNTRNAVSFGGTGSSMPTGYNATGTGPTYSVQAADAGEVNNWLRATFAGANANAGIDGTAKTFANMGWTVGDRIALGVLLRFSQTGADTMKPRVQLNNAGATTIWSPPYDEHGEVGVNSMCVFGEYVAANAAVNFRTSATPTDAGYYEISRPILYNLTANGLA